MTHLVNKTFAKSGLAFHCHHDRLYEWVYDYDERVEYIKQHKLLEEQALRLRLFKLIPLDRIPGIDSQPWEACDEAREACDEARKAYNEAWEAYDEAWGYKIVELHKELCPDCPWDREKEIKKLSL